MYTYHRQFLHTPILSVGWLDADQTVSLVHVRNRWTWEDAHACLRAHTHEQLLVNHPIYSIFLFDKGASIIPARPHALRQLQALLTYDVPHERLVVIVGQTSLFTRFITMTGRVYSLQQIIGKYRFVNTLPEAFALIKQDKQTLAKASQTA